MIYYLLIGIVLVIQYEIIDYNFVSDQLHIAMDKNHNNQMKKIAINMQIARKNIQSGQDVPQNVRAFKDTFAQIDSQLKSQVNTIQSMEQFHHSMSTETTRNLQTKKFMNRIFEKTKAQIKGYMQIVKQTFSVPNKKTDSWQKIQSQMERQLTNLREDADVPEKMYSVINKILTAKDQIIGQFLKSIFYQKHLLWRDINVPYDDYIHSQVKAILNTIKISEEKYGYIPSQLDFKPPKFENDFDQISNVALFNIALQDYRQVLEAIKNFSNLSGQPQAIQGISKNQKIVKGLRQKIELLTINYESLLQKYRSLQISRRGQVGEQSTLSERLEQLQQILAKKQSEISELKQQSQKSQTQYHHLKDKNKELEDEVSKWQKYQLPKIKDLQLTQKSLTQEFNKVRKDLQAYNAIFENEREQKNKILDELKQQKTKINGLVDLLGKEKRKVKQLKAEIARQQQINLQLTDHLQI